MEVRCSLCYLCLIFLCFTFVNCEYDQLYKLYTIDKSDLIPLDDPAILSKCGKINPVTQNLKFLKNGLTGIFWDEAVKENVDHFPESTKLCFQHVQEIHHRSKQGSKNAMRFLDSSSSSPAGILEGTMSNLGDFDQCLNIRLDINDNIVRGKYFHTVVYLLNRTQEWETINRPADRPEERHVRLHEAGLQESGLTLSLCLPDSCSNDNLFEILSETMKCYPDLHFRNDIESDTLKTVSFEYKFSKISTLQKLSIYILISVFTITILATFCGIKIGFMKYFDGYENFYDLTHVKKGEKVRSLFLDMNKTGVLFCAILAHIVTCAESPRALALFSHLNFPKMLMQNIFVQIVAFEGAFTGLAFFSGLATFNEIFPLIRRNRYPFLRMIINKWLRYVPGLIGLLAMELIWPLMGHGPLYNQVAEYNTDKVERYWWSILLFVGNFNIMDYTPVLHTNYSMIDFQLFLLGLVGIYLLVKNPKHGFIFSLAMIFFGFASLAFWMTKYNVQPHFIHPAALIRRLKLNLRFVHFHFHTYLPMYFIGILTAYVVKVLDMTQTSWWKCVYMMILHYLIAIIFPVAYFGFGLIPESMTPIYLVTQKLVMAGGIIWNFLRDDIEEREYKKQMAGKEVKPVLRYEQDEFSPITAGYKMSVATYFINYWFVRLDFFTRRDIWYSGVYPMWTRLVYGLTLIYLIGLIFHLTFFMPFTKWRKEAAKSKVQKQE